ncbi:methionine aminopeptidase [Pseudolysinimonas kribbensis]|uniref:Methionine aminopeptidase n=2 Tax=Pseudolysinimonas kribbensis TaxID=433641 RepID=A0ABQ6K8S2_9MICO|nr:methionine aminopeptidase [Pseudolysinimonas kribbensis]
MGAAVRPGITTDDLDAIGHDYLVAHDAYPSELGYRGYPKSTCTSVNEVICHGIPDDTELFDGDIVKIDITAYVEGMHGDLCAAFPVGEVSQDAALLIDRTHEAMMRGIRAIAPGRQVNVIGRAIESYAKRFGYGVVREYTGHGVGTAFHSGLVIPHYDAAPGYDAPIEPGMVFTVEPMLTIDGSTAWDIWDDDWTVVTRSRALTAQWEHTIVVTERGAEILTRP